MGQDWECTGGTARTRQSGRQDLGMGMGLRAFSCKTLMRTDGKQLLLRSEDREVFSCSFRGLWQCAIWMDFVVVIFSKTKAEMIRTVQC